MPKPTEEQLDYSIEEQDALLGNVKRLAELHQKIRSEQRFYQSIDLEGVSSLLGLALLPLESAIVDLGRLASGHPPLVGSRA